MGNEGKTKNTEREILIVEDSATQAESLRRVLAQRGYKVAIAKNGVDGLNLIRKQKPSLVISDILMPLMDGYQMCQKIKHDQALNDLPVMLLTMLSDPGDVLRGLEVNADNYVTKPFEADYLVSKVESLLDNSKRVKNKPEERGVEVEYAGKRYLVHSGRAQTLNFLLSTYENVLIQNTELVKTQIELKTLNENLEGKIRERTAALSAEVSERKSIEQALRESEERFRTIVESASDAVICIEPSDRIYLWNKKAEEMFGYSAEEAVGKGLHSLIVPERYRQKAFIGLDAFFKSGTGVHVGRTAELDALRKDGSEFPIELSISAMNRKGVWNSIGIVRDITERKKLEDDLKQNLGYVERINKLMVGREIKMEELRTELRVLREKVKDLEGGHLKD